jgi:hypothetical protein
MLLSIDLISAPMALYCRAITSRIARVAGAIRLSAPSAMILSNSPIPLRPLADTMPSSAKCPRRALLNIVRWRTSNCRARCSIKAVCCSLVLIGTNRIDGRVTASQIAAASLASFLLRFR